MRGSRIKPAENAEQGQRGILRWTKNRATREGHLDRMQEICDKIIETGKNFDLWCLMRADNINRPLFKKMKQADKRLIEKTWDQVLSSLYKN